ncbi:DNA-deoxyinosine glycosylase [uncultured Methanolobus sp.]|uniref:DNA-deoxyinosine glycosylase n=1 Tax=uncultured Methanolobus sp. TaxID=218300 RepID=UPI0029C8E599|nr:DNA-deoxyinosine glycosylase [uncultured Methanolobus sp.]
MDPILNEETEILIVGTYPGQISRDQNQYYANPRNQFWRLMSKVLDISLEELDYEVRIETLLQHKIGLWDTLRSCDITGSSDSSIRNEEYNDFSDLSHIRKIICNGKKGENYLTKIKKAEDVAVIVIPSSSPARAIKFEEKVDEWKKALSIIL